MKYLLGGLAAVAAIAAIIAFLVFAWLMIPKGHAYSHSVEHHFPVNGGGGDGAVPSRGADSETRPFVTNEPVDQKANMGMYDDAKGPSWAGMPQAAMTRMPFGVCAKPAIAISFDEHGNSIFAEDNEVIWRCVQASGVSGEWYDQNTHPLVYCHIQREQPRPPALAWRCYHDYSVVFDFYEHDYGKSPLILPDEIEFIETTEIQ